MWRTALRPRWMALLLVVLVAASAMSLLGQWQLQRAQFRADRSEREALSAAERRAPVPIEQVLRARQTFPADAVDRPVLATGRWDGARQKLVVARVQDGRDGFWVLTPLVLADGAAVPVVRGWVPSPDDPAAAAPSDQSQSQSQSQSQVQVRGTLHPAEPPAERTPGQGSGLPAGRISAVSVVDLLDQWPYPLFTGYVLQRAQTPAPAGPAPQPAQLPPPDPGLAWRNVSYALQWWLFAGFGLFFWYRVVRDDHRARVDGGAPGSPGMGEDAPMTPSTPEPSHRSPR